MADVEQPLLRAEHDDGAHSGLQLLLDTPEEVASHAGANVLQTTTNVINIFMGIGLLSMPYAMRLSGWLGLGALILAAALFCISGKLIVRGFDSIPAGKPHSYSQLGKTAMGRPGKVLVFCFASCEFFGASCMTLIVIWRELEAFLPQQGAFGLSSMQLAMGLATLGVVPLLFIPSLRHLSHLSSLGFISTLVVMAAVVASTAADPHRTAAPLQPAPGHEPLHWGIIQAFGIFAVSVSGHSSLPALRSSMAQPQLFGRVLNTAFAAMACIYGVVASLGYYYFGNATSPLITSDLAVRAPFAGRSILFPGLTVDKVVDVFVALNAYTTFPLLILVLQDMVMGVMNSRTKAAIGDFLPYALRLGIFAAACMLSWKAYSVLGLFMSLIGGFCSLSCSLILPSLFCACLYWKEMRVPSRAAIVALMAFGVSTLLVIVSMDLSQLLHELHQYINDHR